MALSNRFVPSRYALLKLVWCHSRTKKKTKTLASWAGSCYVESIPWRNAKTKRERSQGKLHLLVAAIAYTKGIDWKKPNTIPYLIWGGVAKPNLWASRVGKKVPKMVTCPTRVSTKISKTAYSPWASRGVKASKYKNGNISYNKWYENAHQLSGGSEARIDMMDFCARIDCPEILHLLLCWF